MWAAAFGLVCFVFSIAIINLARAQQTNSLWRSAPIVGKSQPCARSASDCIDVDFQVLQGVKSVLVGNAAFVITLPDGRPASIFLTHHSTGHEGTDSFWGVIRGEDGDEGDTAEASDSASRDEGTLTLTSRGSRVYGYLTLKSGFYQIEPDPSGYHTLKRVDRPAPQAETDAFNLSVESGALNPGLRYRSAPTRRATANGTSANFTIDVLFLYTNIAAADIALENGDPDLKFASWIDWTNQAIANSGNDQVRYRLVRTREVSYQQAESMGTDLVALRRADDGLLDEAQTVRAMSGADLVVLVLAHSVGTACGAAYVGEPDRSRDLGFSVVANSCSARTFGHEIGHNMGMRHDPYVSRIASTRSYGHGFVNLEKPFRTIMAYRDQCTANGFGCAIIQNYSNPEILYSGRPTGTVFVKDVATSDNERLLTEMAPRIGGVMPTAEPGTFGIAGRANTKSGFPVGKVRLSLTGDGVFTSDKSTETNDLGSFIFTGVADGKYSIKPSLSGFSFSPASAAVEIVGGDVLGVDFQAIQSESKMAVAMIERPEGVGEGNNDGQANPGELKSYSIAIKNTSNEPIHWPRLVVNTENVSEYADVVIPTSTTIRLDLDAHTNDTALMNIDPFWIDGDAPAGEALRIPWVIYDGYGHLMAADILEIPVSGSDQTPPIISERNTYMFPSIVEFGEKTTLSTTVEDGSEISDVTAIVRDADSDQELERVILTEQLKGNQFQAIYRPREDGTFKITFQARDDKGNISRFEVAERLYSKGLNPLRRVLVISNLSDLRGDLAAFYRESLDDLGVGSDEWLIQDRGMPSTELLLLYDYVVWTAGEPDLTLDRESGYDLIQNYLEQGGRLLLAGNRLASVASRARPGWLEAVAGASHLMDAQWRATVTGVSGQESENLSFRLTGFNDVDLMRTLRVTGGSGTPDASGSPGTSRVADSLFTWHGGPPGSVEGNAAVELHTDVYDIVLATFGLEKLADRADRNAVLATFVEALNSGGRNRAPRNIAAVDSMNLVLDGVSTSVDLVPLFLDPDLDDLTYRASSSDSAVAEASIVQSSLVITPISGGEADITVFAEDGNGQSATTEVFVNVTMPVHVGVEASGADAADASADAAADAQAARSITLELEQNYPNPFSSHTTIQFSLPEFGPVSLRVFDLLGRQVRLLVDERLGPGNHTVNLDTGALASGLYIYRLDTRDAALTRSMLLVN